MKIMKLADFCNKKCSDKPCCTQHEGVFLRPEEATWLKLKFPQLTYTIRHNEIEHQNKDFLVFKNGRCPLLNNRNRCIIYKNRPRVCYWYPCDFRELLHGKTTFKGACRWVEQYYDELKALLQHQEAPEDGTKQPDRRLFRLKLDIICELMGFMHDIPRGNKSAKEEIKIW